MSARLRSLHQRKPSRDVERSQSKYFRDVGNKRKQKWPPPRSGILVQGQGTGPTPRRDWINSRTLSSQFIPSLCFFPQPLPSFVTLAAQVHLRKAASTFGLFFPPSLPLLRPSSPFSIWLARNLSAKSARIQIYDENYKKQRCWQQISK